LDPVRLANMVARTLVSAPRSTSARRLGSLPLRLGARRGHSAASRNQSSPQFHRQATGSGARAYPTTRKTFLSQSRQGAKRTSRSVLSGEKCSLCVSAPWREISSRHRQVGLNFGAIAQFNCTQPFSHKRAQTQQRE
jgi:hypothetical protein